LTVKHRINFIKWYIYFTNEKWVFLAIGHTSNKRKGQPERLPLYYCLCVNRIADRLISTRACFLFRLTAWSLQIIFLKITNHFSVHYHKRAH
jgi:hypothetical protein